MVVCEEMQKYRDWLNSKGIDWFDKSEEFKFGLDMPDDYICRTQFFLDGNLVSVINGLGSYGGYYFAEITNSGQLEIMAWFIDGGEPRGYLTAEEVIQLISKQLGE